MSGSSKEGINEEAKGVNQLIQTENSNHLLEIAKVSHNSALICISTDSSEKNPRRFFFEPIVLLDTESISCQTHKLFKKEVVRFSIKMWNAELRSKVRDRVQSLPAFKDLKIHDDDIFVMPYDEIKLVLKPGSSMDPSIQLMDQPKKSFYRRSNESLDFYFICDSKSTASALADNFYKYPDFVLQKWKLALECRGLVLGNGVSSKSLIDTFDVSTLPFEETDDDPVDDQITNKQHEDGSNGNSEADSVTEYFRKKGFIIEGLGTEGLAYLASLRSTFKGTSLSDKDRKANEKEAEAERFEPNSETEDDEKREIGVPLSASHVEAYKHQSQDVTDWMLAMPGKKAITVFSAKKCFNPTAAIKRPWRKSKCGHIFPGLLTFSNFDSHPVEKHGDFDLKTGTFTVKTSGVYLLHFSGYCDGKGMAKDSTRGACVQLRIEGSFNSIAKSIDADSVRRLFKSIEYPPIVISALVPLKAGQKIKAFANRSWLHEAPPTYITRFSASLFTDSE